MGGRLRSGRRKQNIGHNKGHRRESIPRLSNVNARALCTVNLPGASERLLLANNGALRLKTRAAGPPGISARRSLKGPVRLRKFAHSPLSYGKQALTIEAEVPASI